MSVDFHVKLLNILGFVHLPEKYFEIKGVLNLITCIMFFLFIGGGGGGGWGGGTLVRFFNFSIQ